MALSSDQHPNKENNPQDPSKRGSLTAEFLATNHCPKLLRKISQTLIVDTDSEEGEDTDSEREEEKDRVRLNRNSNIGADTDNNDKHIEEEEVGSLEELSMWKLVIAGVLFGYIAMELKERAQNYFQ